MDCSILLNIIIGLIIGVLLATTVKPLYIYHGPNSNIVKKNIYKQNGKCYRLKPVIHLCAK